MDGPAPPLIDAPAVRWLKDSRLRPRQWQMTKTPRRYEHRAEADAISRSGRPGMFWKIRSRAAFGCWAVASAACAAQPRSKQPKRKGFAIPLDGARMVYGCQNWRLNIDPKPKSSDSEKITINLGLI